MPARDLSTAQHEAAHVVVGVALGLRLRAAVVGTLGEDAEGYAAFDSRGPVDAFALMLAAGVYYEQRRGCPASAGYDRAELRALCDGKASRVRVYVIAAGAILESRRAAWEKVTAALLERDITGADIVRLARGENIGEAPE